MDAFATIVGANVRYFVSQLSQDNDRYGINSILAIAAVPKLLVDLDKRQCHGQTVFPIQCVYCATGPVSYFVSHSVLSTLQQRTCWVERLSKHVTTYFAASRMKTETVRESWPIRRRSRFRGSSDIMLESYQLTCSYCGSWNPSVERAWTNDSVNQIMNDNSVKKKNHDSGSISDRTLFDSEIDP